MAATMTFRGQDSKLAISAQTLVLAGSGRIARVSVLVAGSSAGTINDAATTGAVASTNEIAVIPNAVGVYEIDFRFYNGLVITPGTGQTVSISYTGVPSIGSLATTE